MVAQSAGVDVRRLEVVPQRVHRDQGGISRHVAEVVPEGSPREFRATGGFDGHDADRVAAGQPLSQKREGQPCEVAAAAEAADHHVRLGVGHLHLRDGFLSDDGLVQ